MEVWLYIRCLICAAFIVGAYAGDFAKGAARNYTSPYSIEDIEQKDGNDGSGSSSSVSTQDSVSVNLGSDMSEMPKERDGEDGTEAGTTMGHRDGPEHALTTVAVRHGHDNEVSATAADSRLWQDEKAHITTAGARRGHDDELSNSSSVELGRQIELGRSALARCTRSSCNPGDTCALIQGKVVCYRNYCSGHECNSHGMCYQTMYRRRCLCDEGYSGEWCEIALTTSSDPADVCNPNPCKGDCECRESCRHELGYFCASRGGFVGKNCTIPSPRVNCGERSIVLDISPDLYQELDKGIGNTYFFVSPYSHGDQLNAAPKTRCSATGPGSFRIVIPLPFKECGTTILRSGSELIVRNRLYADRQTNLFGMEVPVVDFECRYRSEYQLVTSLQPVITQPNKVTQTGRFQPDIELCKIPSCGDSCPLQLSVEGGAVYTVGEMIHFSATVLPEVGFSDFSTIISSMELRCHGSSGQGSGMMMVRDGCTANTGFYMATNSTGRYACGRIQTPSSPCPTMYIHLHLQVCHKDDLQPCSPGTKMICAPHRFRRSAELRVLYDGVDAIYGPIVLINGSRGWEVVELFPESSDRPFRMGRGIAGVGPTSTTNATNSAKPATAKHFVLDAESVRVIVIVVGICGLFLIMVTVIALVRCCASRGARHDFPGVFSSATVLNQPAFSDKSSCC